MRESIFLFVVILIYPAELAVKAYEDSARTLQLLHVVFRHGERTQDTTYATDPYKYETYYPIGVGQLTNEGKLKSYHVGEYLRTTYGDFLGDTYTWGIVEAISSAHSRCRASMQLVLAALFPPRGSLVWFKHLDWQPIPYDYLPESDDLLFWPTKSCPKFELYAEVYRNSTGYQELYRPHQKTLDFLIQKSQFSNRAYVAGMLQSVFSSQVEWGLELPKWSQVVWPHVVRNLATLSIHQMFATEEMKALGGGFFLGKIINDTNSKLNKEESAKDRRIHIYSGHDLTIAALLSVLGQEDYELPNYGAFLVFEIHEMDGFPFIRIRYQNYEQEELVVLEIPGCGYFCPFQYFTLFYSKYLNPYNLCENQE